jgi:segregation and condensation protein B
MSTSESASESPEDQEVSLDELSRAFAEAMSGRDVPPQPKADMGESGGGAGEGAVADKGETELEGPSEKAAAAGSEPTEETDPVEISPRTILEAMLFVGNQDNEPLTGALAAEVMRGVEPAEIPDLVNELNRRYAANACPYHIVNEADGYRLVLHKAFDAVRLRFYGKAREARLSQAAIDVLAIVAYRQPLTADEVNKLRGTPSSHVLSQLVRRRLLRIERPEGKRKPALYHVTDRFLGLFGLDNLDDLPQAEEVENH